MGVDISVTTERDATVVRLAGTADKRSLHRSWRSRLVAEADTAHVVVDLDGVVVATPEALRELIEDLGGGPRVRLVARRNSVVERLVRWRIHHLVDLHRSLDDALAATRLMAGER